MNRTNRRIPRAACLTLALLLLLLPLYGCRSADVSSSQPPSSSVAAEHEPITQELIAILENDAAVKAMLEKSIAMAKEINPDKDTNPAQTLSQYYDYVDWAAKAMPWNISKKVDSDSLYTKIDQSLNYFYFINDQPLEELDGKGLYHNSLQYAEPYRSWLIKFTRQWGEYLSTAASWNDEHYSLLYADERFGLQKGWYEPKENWTTFNEFFARYLSAPEQRPISAEGDDAVVTSPADSTPQGVWEIDANSNLVQKGGVQIKSKAFDSIPDLLGEGSAYRDAFAGGVLTHTFLDVHDYHRYHFPVSGTIREVTLIEQDDAVGGWITWDPESELYVLNAETPGWQMVETRGLVVVETAEYGMVALLPVGMSQVSSVNFEDAVKVGATVEKGDPLGYFLFGGSDFILLFQKNAGFELTAPLDRADDGYAHLLMGEEYGRLTKKAA